MDNTQSIRTVVLAAKGNQNIYGPINTPIYAAPSDYQSDDAQILVAPGQIVIADAKTNLALSAASTKTTNPFIKIGVAYDFDGDGQSDYIHWILNTQSGCSLLYHNATPPVCGVGSIVDVFANGACIQAGQTYTLEVQLYDPETEAYGDWPNQGYTWTFSYTVPSGGCPSGNCPPTVNADTLMCGLYNLINGINHDPNWDVKLNNIPLDKKQKFPFEVAMLYDAAAGVGDTTYEYCFGETSSECSSCDTFIKDVGGFSSVLGSLDETFDPVTWVEVGEGEEATKESKRYHLEQVAKKITKLLDGKGHAVYLAPTGACCTNHKIEVNTCLTDFVLLDGDGVAIADCGSTNPYATVTNYGECKNCDSSNSTWLPTIGWRFYFKAVQAQCQCIPNNKSKAEYYVEGNVYPKYGFDQSGTVVIKRQASTVTEGQGFQWQAIERASLEGYNQVQFNYDNFGGVYGLPENSDFTKFIKTECGKAYCAISTQFAEIVQRSVAGETIAPQVTAHILIDKLDTGTITSFLTFWNAYFAGGVCGVTTLSCA